MIVCVTLNPCIERCLFIEGDLPSGKTFRTDPGFWLVGGKGINVARALTLLKKENIALTFAGGLTGEIMLKEIKKEKINTKYIWTAAPTRIGFFVFDTKVNGWREFLEEGGEITGTECREMIDAFKETIKNAEWACLSGSSPCSVSDFVFAEMVSIAKDAGVKVLLDTYGPPLKEALNKGPDILKVNATELKTSLGENITNEEVYLNLRRAGGKTLIVTDGGNDVYLYHGRDRIKMKPPETVVKNPVGSGDCFAAGMLYGFLEGWDMVNAVAFGVAAGTANASKLHVAAIEKSEIEGFLGQVEIFKGHNS